MKHRNHFIFANLILALFSSCEWRSLPTTRSDLIPVFDTNYKRIATGTKIVFDYSVKNNGPDDVQPHSYRVRLTVNGTEASIDNRGNVFLLKVGSVIKYTKSKGYYDFMPDKPGSYQCTLEIQANDSNQTNNKIEQIIEVN